MKTIEKITLTTEQVVQILQNSSQNTFEAILTTEENSISYMTSPSVDLIENITNRNFTLEISCKINRIEFMSDNGNICLEGVQLSSSWK